jgi:hypothetical protein
MDLTKFIDTTLTNSGCSLSFNTGVINPPVGYFSAHPGAEMIIKIQDFTQSKAKVLILPYLIQNEQALREHGNFLGAWVDSNLVYIDISKQYHCEATCKAHAIKNKQQSYYDAKNKKTIFV